MSIVYRVSPLLPSRPGFMSICYSPSARRVPSHCNGDVATDGVETDGGLHGVRRLAQRDGARRCAPPPGAHTRTETHASVQQACAHARTHTHDCTILCTIACPCTHARTRARTHTHSLTHAHSRRVRPAAGFHWAVTIALTQLVRRGPPTRGKIGAGLLWYI